MQSKLLVSVALVALLLTAPAVGQELSNAADAPWFEQLSPENRERLERAQHLQERTSRPAAFTLPLEYSGYRLSFPRECQDESQREIEITFDGGRDYEWRRAASFRGDALGCVPVTGRLTLRSGETWLGEVAKLADGANTISPVPRGPGLMLHQDGRFEVYDATRSNARMRNGQQLDLTSVRLGRSATYLDSPFSSDEAREFGANGRVSYHFANGGSLVATVDNGQVIGDGVLTREGIRITGALERGANAFFAPFAETAPARPSDAIGFTIARRIETSVDSSIGPPGAYLMSGPLAFNELPSPEEVRPEPGTLARYAPQAQSCAYRPAIPPGWLYWGPDCAARPDRIDAWAVNGAYRLRFARIERRDFTVLQEMHPEQPGRVRREWRGARFDMSGLVPTPQGTAELWSDGALVFNGPFSGVEPHGEGFCGRSEAEGGGVEPCTYAGGQRADALYLARIEQERLDAQFAARAAEAQRLRAEREQERITAQREEARRIAQAAADRRAAQRAQNDAFWGAVVSGFGQASVQIQAQQDADAANMAAFNAQLAETQRRIAAQQAANAATAPASAGASAPRGGPPPPSAPPPSAAPPARIVMPSSAPSSSATSASAPAAPIAMQEAVVICPMRDGLLGGVTCYGPAGQGFATVSNIGDIATICHAGRARTTPREYSRQSENRIFGCGYGIDPTRPGVNEPPNLDATVRVPASIPERRLFHCAPGTNFCTTP